MDQPYISFNSWICLVNYWKPCSYLHSLRRVNFLKMNLMRMRESSSIYKFLIDQLLEVAKYVRLLLKVINGKKTISCLKLKANF